MCESVRYSVSYSREYSVSCIRSSHGPEPIRAKISALGTYLPPRVLTNADLEKMVDTTNEWIMERVGIRERHLVDKGVAASDLAVEAVKKSGRVASLRFAGG